MENSKQSSDPPVNITPQSNEKVDGDLDKVQEEIIHKSKPQQQQTAEEDHGEPRSLEDQRESDLPSEIGAGGDAPVCPQPQTNPLV